MTVTAVMGTPVNTGSGAVAVTLPSYTSSDVLAIVCTKVASGSNSLSCSTTGWTVEEDTPNTNGVNAHILIAYALGSVISGATTVTIGSTGGTFEYTPWCLTGCNLTTPVRISPTPVSGTGTSASIGSSGTAQAGDYCLMAATWDNTVTSPAVTGYTLDHTGATQIQAHRSLSGTDPTAAASWGTSRPYILALVVFAVATSSVYVPTSGVMRGVGRGVA